MSEVTQSKMRYMYRKENNLCTRCGKPKGDNYYYVECFDCRVKEAERKRQERMGLSGKKDMVEVVRCKDCKHGDLCYKFKRGYAISCIKSTELKDLNGYCDKAEPKEVKNERG